MITLWMQMSLDGYAAGPDGELDWPVVDEELHSHFVAELRQADAFLYGRRIFEMMAAFWPTADEMPGATHNQAEYARIWRADARSASTRGRSRATLDWNATAAQEIGAGGRRQRPLRRPRDRNARSSSSGLIDEYRLFIHPVALGDGLPLFPDRTNVKLVSARTFDSAVVAVHYERAV